MSPTVIEIASISSPLPTCSPNLMPFHIEYSGPAPISTYFRVKPASSRVGTSAAKEADPETLTTTLGDDDITLSSVGDPVTTTSLSDMILREGDGDKMEKSDTGVVRQGTSQQETNQNSSTKASLWKNVSNNTARLVAAFRGRTVHGLQVDMPEGYVGLVLRAEGDMNGQVDSADAMMERKARVSRAMSKQKPKAAGRGKRTSVQAVDVDSDDGDGSIRVNVEEDGMLEGDESRRTLKPTDKFSSFVLWHPDNPVDEGKDEYYRSLTEWTTLASQIHQCE